MNVIQCYTPTNDYNEEIGDKLYDKLQSVVEKYRTKNLTILIGDVNVKVGMDNTRYEDNYQPTPKSGFSIQMSK
ncbi:unnamed protein product [Schistosoma margrebowiei]|uniref:Uncharacterized protein n=1 Tax=Schistosoma margrebowiei TaxID=48269 RepID=A0A183LTE3_9TREM|nr:unnamed protein product [Schistosoma margrebowiei]